MERLTELRKAHQRLALRALGTRTESPRMLASQRKAEVHTSELMALPEEQLDPIQVLDGPNLGTFIFMMGYDPPGSAPL